MTDRVLLTSDNRYGGTLVQFRIELNAQSLLPFTLECGRDRRGTRHFLELPRSYKTARGAKLAAAKIFGEPLVWTEPKA